MNAETITVVVAEPGKAAEVREIPNSLQALQEIVGGYIEELPRAFEIAGCVIVANEDGHPLGLPPNREWPRGTVLLGTIVVVKRGVEGDYVSVGAEHGTAVLRVLEESRVQG